MKANTSLMKADEKATWLNRAITIDNTAKTK
jgi:hypothetical protein